MFKGSNRKMFRKPGMARRAIGILASSPEIMQAANRNMPVRLQGGGDAKTESIQQQINRRNASLFGFNLLPDFFGNRLNELRQSASNMIGDRTEVSTGDQTQADLIRNLPNTRQLMFSGGTQGGGGSPVNVATANNLLNQKDLLDMSDDQLKTRQAELVAQLKGLDLKKDATQIDAVKKELDKISSLRSNVGKEINMMFANVPGGGIGDMTEKVVPTGQLPSSVLNVGGLNVSTPPVTVPDLVAAKREVEKQTENIQNANNTSNIPLNTQQRMNRLNLGGDPGDTVSIEKDESTEKQDKKPPEILNTQQMINTANLNFGGGTDVEVEARQAQNRASIAAMFGAKKFADVEELEKVTQQVADLQAQGKKVPQAIRRRLQRLQQLSGNLTAEDIAAEAPAVETPAVETPAVETPVDDSTDESSDKKQDKSPVDIREAVEVGMNDKSAVAAVKEILADLGQPPELAEQPDIWHYITLAGLGIAAGRSDDPLSNIADGILVAFNQKTKDDKDFADSKYTRYLNDANLKLKEFELGLDAQRVEDNRLKIEAEAEKNRLLGKAYGASDSKENRLKALIEFYQGKGLELGDATGMAEAIVDGKTDLAVTEAILGKRFVERSIARGDISIPTGKKPVPVDTFLGTFTVTRTGKNTAKVEPFTSVYQPPKPTS